VFVCCYVWICIFLVEALCIVTPVDVSSVPMCFDSFVCFLDGLWIFGDVFGVGLNDGRPRLCVIFY
jgi:hypothetical protein